MTTNWTHTTPLAAISDYLAAMILLRVEGADPGNASLDVMKQVSVASILSSTISPAALAAALSSYIARDGSVAPLVDLPMGGHHFTNMNNGTAATDSINKGYVDGAVSGEASIRSASDVALSASLTSLATISSVGKAYATASAMNADLVPAAGTLCATYNDPTAANNGFFVKVGATGTGSWAATGIGLPATFATMLATVTAQVAALGANMQGLNIYTGNSLKVAIIVDLVGGTMLGIDVGTGIPYGSMIDNLKPAGGTTSLVSLASGDAPIRKDWNGFLHYGQSNASAADSIPPLSTTQQYSNLTFGGGVRASKSGNTQGATYTAPGTSTVVPLVEGTSTADGYSSEGESICVSMSDAAVEIAARGSGIDPSAFVIFASVASHSSYVIGSLSKGAAWYQQVIDHVTEAKARATTAGKAFAVHAVGWDQGEANVSGTSRATYAATLVQLQIDLNTDICAITGQTTPVHLLTIQTPYQVQSVSPNVALGQFDAINQSTRIHFVGPRFHLDYPNNLHMSNVSQWRIGKAYGRAFEQLVIEGRKPDCVWPISATAVGTTLKIKYRVPRLPLVLDSLALATTTDNGFKVTDGTGTLTLSNPQIVDGDTVQLTLNRALGSSPVVRYALDYLGTGLNILGGASGNLRDSTLGTKSINGTAYPLFHLAPHHQLNISLLGS